MFAGATRSSRKRSWTIEVRTSATSGRPVGRSTTDTYGLLPPGGGDRGPVSPAERRRAQGQPCPVSSSNGIAIIGSEVGCSEPPSGSTVTATPSVPGSSAEADTGETLPSSSTFNTPAE